MTPDEQSLFASLLMSHKHLWIAFQEFKHRQEFPDDDPEVVHGRFCDAADEVYRPVVDALLEEMPLRDALQTVLLVSDLTRIESKNQ